MPVIRLEIGALAAWTPAEFKEKFYRCPWAKYEDAKVDTMKLMPPERNMQALKDDYEHMQNMIFGNKTEFQEIMSGMKKLEDEMNSL